MSKESIPVITEVLGITNPSHPVLAYNQAHMMLTGKPYNPNYYAALASKPYDIRTQLEREWMSDSQTIGELVFNKTIQSASTLADWMVYSSMMRQYGTRSDGSASALMIGSLTPLSSRSFVCLANTEYGASNTHIVDPLGGQDKVRHGKFAYGSGLALPYASGSMDFVHTNQLLHMLKDPSSPSRPAQQSMLLLFSEISRVLAPGGQLLMKEAGSKSITNRHARLDEILDEQERLCTFATSALTKFGIEYVRTGFAPLYKELEALHDPGREFEKHKEGLNARAVAIYARKRPRVPAVPLPGKIAS